MITTLNQIREASPCRGGWRKLLAHLDKTEADNEPLSIITILDSNGLDDALWCLQAVKDYDREIRLYGVWCARQMQHLLTDQRSLDALDVAEKFANGLSTTSELAAAKDAAWAAARVVAGAEASDAARDAAWAVARDAARYAAGAAVGAVARDAAWAAARVAARDAASDAARAAAWAEASDAQEKRLRELCAEVDKQGADK